MASPTNSKRLVDSVRPERVEGRAAWRRPLAAALLASALALPSAPVSEPGSDPWVRPLRTSVSVLKVQSPTETGLEESVAAALGVPSVTTPAAGLEEGRAPAWDRWVWEEAGTWKVYGGATAAQFAQLLAWRREFQRLPMLRETTDTSPAPRPTITLTEAQRLLERAAAPEGTQHSYFLVMNSAGAVALVDNSALQAQPLRTRRFAEPQNLALSHVILEPLTDAIAKKPPDEIKHLVTQATTVLSAEKVLNDPELRQARYSFVAYDQKIGRYVGLVTAASRVRKERNWFRVPYVYAHTASVTDRGRGLGELLMEAVFHAAHKKHFPRVMWESVPAAMNMTKRLGAIPLTLRVLRDPLLANYYAIPLNARSRARLLRLAQPIDVWYPAVPGTPRPGAAPAAGLEEKFPTFRQQFMRWSAELDAYRTSVEQVFNAAELVRQVQRQLRTPSTGEPSREPAAMIVEVFDTEPYALTDGDRRTLHRFLIERWMAEHPRPQPPSRGRPPAAGLEETPNAEPLVKASLGIQSSPPPSEPVEKQRLRSLVQTLIPVTEVAWAQWNLGARPDLRARQGLRQQAMRFSDAVVPYGLGNTTSEYLQDLEALLEFVRTTITNDAIYTNTVLDRQHFIETVRGNPDSVGPAALPPETQLLAARAVDLLTDGPRPTIEFRVPLYVVASRCADFGFTISPAIVALTPPAPQVSVPGSEGTRSSESTPAAGLEEGPTCFGSLADAEAAHSGEFSVMRAAEEIPKDAQVVVVLKQDPTFLGSRQAWLDAKANRIVTEARDLPGFRRSMFVEYKPSMVVPLKAMFLVTDEKQRPPGLRQDVTVVNVYAPGINTFYDVLQAAFQQLFPEQPIGAILKVSIQNGKLFIFL